MVVNKLKMLAVLCLFSHNVHAIDVNNGQTIHKKKFPFLELGCIGGAAFLDAGMDEMRDHPTTSVFKNMNQNFWNPNTDWNKCKTIAGYHVDAWHLSKSLAIILLDVPISTELHKKYPILKNDFLDRALWFSITGVAWNLTFNTFYSNLLK